MQRALFIGGTGTISMAITRQLAQDPDWELWLLNRGNRAAELPENVKTLQADINDEEKVKELIGDANFDCVADFIAFVPEQVRRDYRIFRGRTKQYLCLSSASAYQKPVNDYVITEGTPLANPYWEYSRNKIACEDEMMRLWREEKFPVTIIRPSHTYDERSIPLGVHGEKGSWQVIRRMLDGKQILVQGDGTSLWTMTFNTDFAKAFIGLMRNPHAIGEVFQITSDESLTWNQIYQTIANALNVPYRPYYVASEFLAEAAPYDYRGSLIGDKANSVVFDNSKLKRAVPGFRATVQFEQGIRKAVDYIMAHPECQQEDPAFDAWCDRVIAALEKAKKEICG